MRNVKSTYFINDIFTFINDKRKFEIVLYNKNIQKILGLTILDFRRISGKYIIGDPNKEGKEYNYKGELLFKGEYLNGKRNGKGKEYNKDYENRLKYEGEYLNDKRHGKGKEYGIFDYEGEYLYGKKNGKGKEYSRGNMSFEVNI